MSHFSLSHSGRLYIQVLIYMEMLRMYAYVHSDYCGTRQRGRLFLAPLCFPSVIPSVDWLHLARSFHCQSGINFLTRSIVGPVDNFLSISCSPEKPSSLKRGLLPWPEWSKETTPMRAHGTFSYGTQLKVPVQLGNGSVHSRFFFSPFAFPLCCFRQGEEKTLTGQFTVVYLMSADVPQTYATTNYT